MASSPQSSKQSDVQARRQGRPKRSNQGPLDVGADPLTQAQQNASGSGAASAAGTLQASSTPPPPAVTIVEREQKDFRFLLRADIFQPLSLGDLPAAFRNDEREPENVDPFSLLSQGRFRRAAMAAADRLKKCNPYDYASIFKLYYARLLCLQLLGLHYQAAQESRALQDFNGPYFRSTATGVHLAPWELRILIVRLQAIGFNDWRRGIMAYYELGREAKFRARRSPDQASAWSARLSDLAIRVGNALVELGDLEAAAHHLEQLANDSSLDAENATRLTLLYLRMGNVSAAQNALEHASEAPVSALLSPLIEMASGEYEDAAKSWASAKESVEDEALRQVISQNLAVCLIYMGRTDEAREILDALVAQGNFEQSVTFNLATIYELSSDGAREAKLALAERAAAHPSTAAGWEKSNVDFKL